MPYVIVFALFLAGYTLLDWGHYRVAHQQVSMWYLVSGKGSKTPTPSSKTASIPDAAPQVFAA